MRGGRMKPVPYSTTNLLSPDKKMYGCIFAGLLYGNFVMRAYSNMSMQPDIRKSGMWISHPLILFANMIIIMVIGFLLLKICSHPEPRFNVT